MLYDEVKKIVNTQKDTWQTQNDRANISKAPKSKGVIQHFHCELQEQLQRDAREKNLETRDMLGKQEGQLTGITKVAYETKETTDQINAKMRLQRDKIIDPMQDVRTANQQVGMAKQLVNRMTRRECCYKAGLYFVIFLLFAAIVTLFVVKIIPKPKQNSIE